ncbi:hypothetical protein TEA_011198 [Camellia sinensis var. sinensis]|uniref:Condensin complex subunit 1 C-terminal domain-containing protein n=1 Tax=Camellia sinensis var. sinensis TaxID=542762 RepID=A0A4S4D372_CAMSN|nr:hypothetical protein TEA_011198 [Camellia sinensis var. sinensis]
MLIGDEQEGRVISFKFKAPRARRKKIDDKQIVPPVLSSFSDQDSRVRYYACEALYNIAKVVRGDFIVFFNKIFDALCKLSADSDPNVQSAAHLLDKLVKVTISLYPSVHQGSSTKFHLTLLRKLVRTMMKWENAFPKWKIVSDETTSDDDDDNGGRNQWPHHSMREEPLIELLWVMGLRRR